MEMKPAEILDKYKQGVEIKILAELNAVSKDQIEEVLRMQGVEVKRPNKRTPKAVSAVSAKADRAKKANEAEPVKATKRGRKTLEVDMAAEPMAAEPKAATEANKSSNYPEPIQRAIFARFDDLERDIRYHTDEINRLNREYMELMEATRGANA